MTSTHYLHITPELLLSSDPRLRVGTTHASSNPNQNIWTAMHQDYSETSILDQLGKIPPEDVAGQRCVHKLLRAERGHYGCLEHPQITLGVAGFPHAVMQQARTHRISVSFDVQSMRYTGQRFRYIDPRDPKYNPDAWHIEDVIYFRPVGLYTDRQGHHYEYTQEERQADLDLCRPLVEAYCRKLRMGFAEEHARSYLPFDFRQDFVVSFTMRSLMHMLDLRSNGDAQLEIRAFANLLFKEFQKWSPEISAWYESNRLFRARLAP
jgi:thymidylate synthase (FAD)